MKQMKHRSPLLWIPFLCAAEELPSAMVTFVAVLMFRQFGASDALATFYAGLLFLPRMLKSFVRSKIRNAGYFKANIHITEFGIFALMTFTAFIINCGYMNVHFLFIHLLLVSVLCARHELLAQMYYNRMLYPRQQRYYNRARLFSMQATVILTYGVMIVFVGLLEVLFKSSGTQLAVHRSWAMTFYLVAGVMLVLSAINILTMRNPRIHNPYRYESLINALSSEVHVVDRIKRRRYSSRVFASLFLLVLPQSLMFFTRVLYLIADEERGGLGCTVQDVGFAQGTIGVIAFTVGIGLGKLCVSRISNDKLFWWMSTSLTISPLFYWLMTCYPQPDNLIAICCMTSSTQLTFGFGLTLSLFFTRYISNERYRNTIDYLYVPMIAASMLIPSCLSGLLSSLLGFDVLFLFSLVIAPLILIGVKLMNCKNILLHKHITEDVMVKNFV